ncbi:MOSC domain-containing protein [Jannaschia sp. W003]|uniref:MOSC domain-containing protein n=1 Tax=Jannaschia sp. W003 TaxID=2867012 RepID=UPI0021A2B1EC|nr:MOSC N-terminal beta barrel domain-containing protein [Jannaschia sp. W003]UWQ20044.1 MOSC domain-containing protein [Jannaschia sp. W003]
MRVASLWRHPIKSHGREPLPAFEVEAGGTVPGDRRWAVAHEAAQAPDGAWSPCTNFHRCAKAPALMAIEAESHEDGTVTLRHPNLADLRFDPDAEADRYLAWIAPTVEPGRAAPARIVRAGARGMTDSDFASISLMNAASHRAVEGCVGHALSPHRWRGNVWFEGEGPWQEWEWVGREVSIGTARFRVAEPITRCRATEANPETGRRDAATLDALAHWGHRDFGVYLECVAPGRVAVGDRVAA